MLKKIVNKFIILTLSFFFIWGCSDNSDFKDKKSLILAVNGFYDSILKKNLADIYEYFPPTFKELRSKEEFMKVVNLYSKEEVMNAFALLPIKKYSIDTIRPLGKKRYEVTVIIHPTAQPKLMKDIMIWKKNGKEWVNESYAKLVKNLISSIHNRQASLENQVIQFKQCKTIMQDLAVCVWDYCSSTRMTTEEFKTIDKFRWVDLLNEYNVFSNTKIPQCPTHGIYSVEYDEQDGKLKIQCSHHSSIEIPFQFTKIPLNSNIGKGSKKNAKKGSDK